MAEARLPAGEGQRRVLRDRGRADPRQEVQARHRHRRGPHRHQAGLETRLRRQPARRRWSWPTASPSPRWADEAEGEKASRGACPSPRSSPARSPASPSPRSSRGCSRSTTRTAPARSATAWAIELRLRRRPGRAGRTRRLHKGAIAPWAKATSPLYTQTLQALARHYGFSMDEAVARAAGEGAGRDPVRLGRREDPLRLRRQRPQVRGQQDLRGRAANLERRWRETEVGWVREELGRYQSETPCEACDGYRLKPEALAVKIAGQHIGEVSRLSIKDAQAVVRGPGATAHRQADGDRPADPEGDQRPPALPGQRRPRLPHARPRASGTLSGGESQRIRLASQIGSGLTGVLYVLDEPSIGLHQRDNARLLGSLKGCATSATPSSSSSTTRRRSCTADYVIDMGPGAGVHGGEIIAQGTPQQIMANPDSLTGQYLSGERGSTVPAERRERTRTEGAARSSARAATT